MVYKSEFNSAANSVLSEDTSKIIATNYKNHLILSLIRWSPGFGAFIRSFESRLGNVTRALEFDIEQNPIQTELLQSMNTAGRIYKARVLRIGGRASQGGPQQRIYRICTASNITKLREQMLRWQRRCGASANSWNIAIGASKQGILDYNAMIG